MKATCAKGAANIRRLLHDRRGSTAVFVAAGLVALTGAVGLATDAARGYLVKAKLSQALDAAALAGGQAFFSPNRDSDIQMYFNANFPAGYMDATLTGPSISVDANNEKLSLNASATIPTSLMKVLGINTMSVSGSTEVTRETDLLDVVLSIDMSGSMNTWAGSGQTRIQAARSAATTLVNILFGSNATNDLLKIGLVPWNSKTNVTLRGTTYNSSLTTTQTVSAFKNPLTGAMQSTVWFANNSPVPLLSAPASSWKGCVYARYIKNASEDVQADVIEGNHSSPTGDWVAWQPIGPEGEPISGSAHCTSSPSNSPDCTPCLSHGIQVMQSSKQVILDAINELLSPTGNTDLPQGLVWGWRMLTPGTPFIESASDLPGRKQQAIVLLTDGENVGGYGDGYKAAFGINSTAQPAMDDRLRKAATNIKAQGIKIYVIQLSSDGLGSQPLMKEIATSPDAPYYNYAPDAAALQTVFQQVANNLTQLRISK